MFNSNFSSKTIKALSRKGIRIVSTTMLPGEDGSFANGETGYCLDNQGEYQVRTFGQVLALAA